MQIEPFFDERTFTLTYVVYDDESKDAVIIDPVLDYEPAASKTWTESVDRVVRFIEEHGLEPRFILETHAHADHISGAQLLKQRYRKAVLAVGERITEVQRVFKDIFNLPKDFPTNGSQFDRLLQEGETVKAGTLEFEVLFTPGHTPACASYLFDDALFTGDALFMPDVGTGRCDFPGGSARDLFHSIHNKIYSLPDTVRIHTGHDYPGGKGRHWAFAATVAEHKEMNVALPAARTEDDFVSWRTARDETLNAPKLLFQSVQVNVDAGRLPDPSENEIAYLRIPLNVFRPAPSPDADVTLETV